MTKDEALRLALEALEDLGYHHHDCPQWPTFVEPANYPKCNCGYDQAITAIKAALEAKDEPVATKNNDGVTLHLGWDDLPVGTKLYTTPPQRTWVGLTDEDLKLLSAEWRIVYGAWMDDFAKDIEAKLKEKNA